MGTDVQRGMVPSLSSLILVLVLFSAGIGIAAAADPIVSIIPPQSPVCVGDDFDVYIQVNPNGNTLEMTQVDLTFDSSSVSLAVADGGMFGMFDAGTQIGDTVTDISGVDSGVSTTGNLAVLHMHADSAGTFTLDLSGVLASTGSAQLSPTVNDGTVTINVCGNDPIVSIVPPQSPVCVGDDFDVYIQVNPNGNTLEMTQVDLTFDPSFVNMVVADGGMFGIFDAGTQIGDMVLDISGVDAGVSATGNLAVLHMHAKSAGTFTLDLSGVLASTGSAQLSPIVNDGTVTIDVCGNDPIVSIMPLQTPVCVGEVFDVYIQVNPNGNTLQMTQVDLTFDSSLVSLSVVDGEMFDIFDAGIQIGDTVVDISGVDAGVSATGNLAVVQMHAKSAGTFTLDLSGVTVGTATGTLTPIIEDGTVMIVMCGNDPIVSITPPQSPVCVGDDFDVYIQVDPNGNTIQMAQADLTFDSSLVSLSVDDGEMFGIFDAGTQSGDMVTDISGVDPGVSATGNLAVLHMHANSAGTFPLDLSGVTVATAMGELTPIVNDGTVTITVCENDPIVTVLYPNGGETLSGEITLVVNATDTDGTIEQVEFSYSINGGAWTVLGYGTPAGGDNYEYSWDTAGVGNDWRNRWMGPNSEDGYKVTTTELQDAIHHWLEDIPIANDDRYIIKAEATDDDGATGEDTSDAVFMIDYILRTIDLQEVIVVWLSS